MRDIDSPNWSAIDADGIRSGVAATIDEAERHVDAIASVPDGRRDFENTVLALDGISDLIGQASGQFGFLAQVAADPALRNVAHEQEQRLDVFASGLGFRAEIDRALKAYATRAETQALPDDAARLLEFALRDYRRNGFDLPAKERDAVQELHERLGPARHPVPPQHRRLRGPHHGLAPPAGWPARFVHRAAPEQRSERRDQTTASRWTTPSCTPSSTPPTTVSCDARSFSRTTTKQPATTSRCWRKRSACETRSRGGSATPPGPPTCSSCGWPSRPTT